MDEQTVWDCSEQVKEEWRTIPGFEDYAVSDLGRIKRIRAGGPNAKVGRILSPGSNGNGYRIASLSVHGKTKYAQVHRLVMLAFVGQCPAGMEVNHKDSVRHNNALVNLEYCTKGDNERHKSRANGYMPHRKCRKLSDDDILRIRSLYGSKAARVVASIYGVHPVTIEAIWSGTYNRHIVRGMPSLCK